MVELTIKFEADKAKKDFQRLARRVKDLRPVYKDFVEFYKEKIVPEAFKTRGATMGKKWQGLSDRYRKRKGKLNPVAGASANLRLKDDLFNAGKGGNGWFQKIKKDSVEFGIKRSVIKYANRHQEGTNGMPQRPYFYTVNNDIPKKAWLFLKDRVEKHLGIKDGK